MEICGGLPNAEAIGDTSGNLFLLRKCILMVARA